MQFGTEAMPLVADGAWYPVTAPTPEKPDF